MSNNKKGPKGAPHLLVQKRVIELPLKEDHIKLCDLLAVTELCPNAGVAKNIIAEGVVKVDGEVELRKRCKILKGQVIEYDGQKVKVV